MRFSLHIERQNEFGGERRRPVPERFQTEDENFRCLFLSIQKEEPADAP